MWHHTCSVQFLYAVNTSSPACRQEGRSPPPPLQPREFPFSSSNIFLPSVPPRRWNPRIFSVSGDPWSKLQISVQEQGKSLTFVFFLLSDSPVHLAANWLPSVKTITLSCAMLCSGCSPGNLTADPWRSLLHYWKIAAKSNKILDSGGGDGGWGSKTRGFVAAEALHSNGLVCLEQRATLPTPPPSPKHSGGRWRRGVIGPLQPEPRLFLAYTMWQRTRKVSCLCFVKCAVTKCWGPPPDDPSQSVTHTIMQVNIDGEETCLYDLLIILYNTMTHLGVWI